MSHIHGTDRHQVLLFPDSLDDYITPDNPVRVIDTFVSSLDLAALGFARATPASSGRPAYDPADLLKLYVYGYLNRLRSSRLLEREATRNIEVMWLVGKLIPDHSVIARFRCDNLAALKAVCREFTLLCESLELFGGELVAIDGSKFKAVNNRKRNFTAARLAKLLLAIESKIDAYMQMLTDNDAHDDAQSPPAGVTKLPNADEIKTKLAQLRQRHMRYQQAQAEMTERGETQVSLTDPDSRSMVTGHGSTDVCYNVQTAVDAKHKLIVAYEVTNDVSDLGHLSEMAVRAKQTLSVEEMEVVADMGYYDGEQVKECIQAGITPYVAKPQTSANKKRGLFTKEDFTYHRERDCYMCPQGEELSYRFETVELGRHIRYYATPACRGCPIKAQCTSNKGGRRITRWVDEGLLEEMAQRVRDNPLMMKSRQQIVEHPFGTMKRAMTSGYFLMRGLKKVSAEMSLTVLAYNMKRVVNIFGVPRLLQAVG